ncbi:MAG TPA: DUF3352 domain-containing protein [Gemmataceae bacterium]|nr:DUF3352 domain-containing protein [Gemmataceae bacterium]
MKLRTLCPILIALAAAVAPPLRAEVKDPADLVPAGTLAYLELNQPGQTGKDLAVLLKGSALDDLPGVLAKFREKLGERDYFGSELSILGSFIGPEVLAEASRIQGGAVALISIGKDRQPEIAAYLLTGESNAPGFVMRAFLTSYPWMRSAGECEGVRLYRTRPFNFGPRPIPPGGGPGVPPAKVELTGATYAMMPGLIIVGSSPDSVKDVIRRAKGKTNAASLASVATFKEAAKLRERPGLFGYADPSALSAALVLMGRSETLEGTVPPPPPREAPKGDEVQEPALKQPSSSLHVGGPEMALINTLINTKALRALVASLTLRNGDVDLQMQLILDSKQSSPLLELLPDKPVNPQLLHAVPRGSVFAITRGLTDGEKRWAAKASGTPEVPSKMVKAAEDKLGLHFGKDVFGKINGLALSIPARWEIPKGGTPLPMLSIGAADEEAAKSLEDTIPKLVAFASRDEVSPSTEEIDGHKIRSVAGSALPWRTALHYGRHGNVLVIGQDRKQVAAALTGAAKKEGLLAEEKVATAIKTVKAPIVLGVWSAGPTLAQSLTEAIGSRSRPGFAEKPLPPGVGGGDPPPAPPKKGGPAAPRPADKRASELMKITDSLPPVVITVQRKSGTLTVTARQPALKTVSAKLITAVVETALQASLFRLGPPVPGQAIIEEAAPVPVKP